MKLLIITTDKSFENWRSRKSKLLTLSDELNAMQNGTITVDYQYLNVKPEVHETGFITHRWFDTLRDHFDAELICLHISTKQAKSWGIKTGLRGARQNDRDDWGEMYVIADEGSRRGRHNRFIETTLHEVRHELMAGMGLPDDTHDIHPTTASLRGTFKDLDQATYRTRFQLEQTKKSLIARLREKRDRLKAQVDKERTGPTDLLPLVQERANAVIAEMKRRGHAVRIVEGYRTLERQTELYNQGRTTRGAIVTNAKAGESLHNYGVAVDFVFRREGYNASEYLWQLLGKVGKDQGFEWGGDWQGFIDRPHFELKQGYTLKDFQNNRVDWSKWDSDTMTDMTISKNGVGYAALLVSVLSLFGIDVDYDTASEVIAAVGVIAGFLLMGYNQWKRSDVRGFLFKR
jgi:peptidoglycan L-alanyl-D-glutamate endopeptidase CwlK